MVPFWQVSVSGADLKCCSYKLVFPKLALFRSTYNIIVATAQASACWQIRSIPDYRVGRLKLFQTFAIIDSAKLSAFQLAVYTNYGSYVMIVYRNNGVFVFMRLIGMSKHQQWLISRAAVIVLTACAIVSVNDMDWLMSFWVWSRSINR